MFTKRQKKIVVIGGGTGTYTVLSGLKKYPPDVFELTAIVTVADSGGSTGRLRDEFGYLPVGDFRMALVALADDNEVSNALRNLFLYRFTKGTGLAGHNFGNLLLVAMTDLFGSEEKALEFASQILRVRGNVLPVSNKKLTLSAQYANGALLCGETYIDEPPRGHDCTNRISKLWVEPDAEIAPRARDAVINADLIVMGPGDLYTSILANIVVPGMKDAITASSAKFVYITNLMTKYGQTHNFSAKDHIEELIRYTGRHPDFVLINNALLPKEILRGYAAQQEYPVIDDLKNINLYSIARDDFLAYEEVVKSNTDALKRSLIRHDPHKLADSLVSFL